LANHVFWFLQYAVIENGAREVQNVRTIHSSWMSTGNIKQWEDSGARLDLGPSLLQLVVSEIDGRLTSKPADVIAVLAYFAGRIAQRTALIEKPESFRLDQSSNGVSFLRSDEVTDKLFVMKSGSLAPRLVECALLAGANRFPDFQYVRQNAHEEMQRRACICIPEEVTCGVPHKLAEAIQTDIDSLLTQSEDRQVLASAIIDACGLAIGYARHKIAPALGAELAMSVALYAGWLDQRKFGVR
jgi:hypothetical protein